MARFGLATRCRGSVGNGGRGWLHKGDVSIHVGEVVETTELTLRRGSAYSFFPSGGTAGLTSPRQSRVDRSSSDRSLLILRVGASAEGVDQFSAGGDVYSIQYVDVPSVTRPDAYVYDPFGERLLMNPMANDDGSGYRWLHEIGATVGLGSSQGDPQYRSYFPTSFVMVGAQLLDPELGELEAIGRRVVVDGQRVNRPTGVLSFEAKPGARGVARIRYTVEDATGKRESEMIHVLIYDDESVVMSKFLLGKYHIPSSRHRRTFVDDTTGRTTPTGSRPGRG